MESDMQKGPSPAELERQLADAADQLGDSLDLNRQLAAELEELRVRTAGVEQLQKEYLDMSNSVAYRAGRLIVDAFTKPGRRTLLLPFRLAWLVFERIVVRKMS